MDDLHLGQLVVITQRPVPRNCFIGVVIRMNDKTIIEWVRRPAPGRWWFGKQDAHLCQGEVQRGKITSQRVFYTPNYRKHFWSAWGDPQYSTEIHAEIPTEGMRLTYAEYAFFAWWDNRRLIQYRIENPHGPLSWAQRETRIL